MSSGKPIEPKNEKSFSNRENSSEDGASLAASEAATASEDGALNSVVDALGDALGGEEEKALVRKMDLYLMPAIWVMYTLSYVDRTNIGNAKIASMLEDLDMDSSKYSASLVAYFVPYVVFEVPSNMILARSRPSIFLPAIMLVWGVLTVATGFVRNYAALVGLRAAVGVFQAGFSPGVMLLLNSWYRRHEQGKRFAVYTSAAILSGALGGLAAGGIVGWLDGVRGLAGWRWLFILEGAVTAACAVAASLVLLDFPGPPTTKTTRGKLSEREQALAIARIQSDRLASEQERAAGGRGAGGSGSAEERGEGTKDSEATPAASQVRDAGAVDPSKPMTHVYAFRAAVTNWRTWLFVIGYTTVIGSSTLSYFYPSLVQGLGYTAMAAQYMTAPIYGIACVVTGAMGCLADLTIWVRRRGALTATCMATATACALASFAIGARAPVGAQALFASRYALLVVMASALWSANTLALSFASATFAASEPDVEARAVHLALINGVGNLAQIYGAYLFPDGDERHLMGFGVITCLCLVGVVTYLALHILLRRFPP